MKFCIIMNEKGETLGREYEKPYEYSSWTSGGDYWSTVWGDIFDDREDDDIFKALIFENKEAAKKYVKESSSYFFDKNEKIKIVNLGEL